MTEPRDRSDRERRVGALALAAATLAALVIVAVALQRDRDDDRLAALPTSSPTTVPLPPPPVSPATPTIAPAATQSPAPLVASMAPPDGRNVVCIDPGHGGSDRGNVRVEDGEIVLQEKDLTLQHSLALADRLQARGIEVALTRSGDVEANPTNADVNGDATVAPAGGEATSDELDDLQARVLACNAAGADLLVSVHYNGAENEALQGYEVWYNDERPFSERSARFAELIHEELGTRMAAAGYDAFDKGIGIEAHAVTGPERPGELVPAAMPGAVVEGLFLSNDEDAAFVVGDGAADALVTAYEAAVVAYFAKFSG